MSSKSNDAVATAVEFMSKNGYRHGSCINVVQSNIESDEQWEVELAYDGLHDRSPTSDPPSIKLDVNIRSGKVTPIELM